MALGFSAPGHPSCRASRPKRSSVHEAGSGSTPVAPCRECLDHPRRSPLAQQLPWRPAATLTMRIRTRASATLPLGVDAAHGGGRSASTRDSRVRRRAIFPRRATDSQAASMGSSLVPRRCRAARGRRRQKCAGRPLRSTFRLPVARNAIAAPRLQRPRDAGAMWEPIARFARSWSSSLPSANFDAGPDRF